MNAGEFIKHSEFRIRFEAANRNVIKLAVFAVPEPRRSTVIAPLSGRLENVRRFGRPVFDDLLLFTENYT